MLKQEIVRVIYLIQLFVTLFGKICFYFLPIFGISMRAYGFEKFSPLFRVVIQWIKLFPWKKRECVTRPTTHQVTVVSLQLFFTPWGKQSVGTVLMCIDLTEWTMDDCIHWARICDSDRCGGIDLNSESKLEPQPSRNGLGIPYRAQRECSDIFSFSPLRFVLRWFQPDSKTGWHTSLQIV